MKSLSVTVLAALPLVAIASPAPPAAPVAPRSQAQVPTAKVSGAEVQEFAQLYLQVHKIQLTYGQKIQAAKDKQARAALQHEGGKKINHAVEQSPLSANRYNQIARAAKKDQQLKKRLIAAIRKAEPRKG